MKVMGERLVMAPAVVLEAFCREAAPAAPADANQPGILAFLAAGVELATQRAVEVFPGQDVDVVRGGIRADGFDRLQWEDHAAGLGEPRPERNDHGSDLPRRSLPDMGGE